MRGDHRDFDTVSDLLHQHYDMSPVSVELARRVGGILSAATEGALQSTPLASRRSRPVNRRQRRATFWVVAAVAVLIVGGALVTHALTATPAHVVAAPASLVGVSRLDACDTPNGPFAHFFVIDQSGRAAMMHPGTVGAAAVPTSPYQGTVKVGAATVPTLSVYASHGAIGSGYLCLTAAASSKPAGAAGSDPGVPVLGVLAAQPGALAYVGLLDSDQPWGAVAPGITSVHISVGSGPDLIYTSQGDEWYRLRPLAAGWHVFNSYGGFSGNGPVRLTVTAYAGSILMDRKTLTSAGVPTSQPPSPATR